MSDLGLESASEGDVAGLAPLVRRVVGARVSDASTVNDVVQETLTRVLAVRSRLDESAVAPYAVVTARNLVVLATSNGSPPPPPAPPPLVVQTDPPVPLSGARPMASYGGRTVEARGAGVLSLSGEGFWVGTSDADRVFVEVEGGAAASPRVAVGQRVSFVGRLVPNTPEHLEELRVVDPGDKAQLARQGHHIDVADQALRLG